MCGIAGMIGERMEPETVECMLKTMHRRGPDEASCWQGEMCSLLHSRLAVIDLERGKQPMELKWENETYLLIYNGELYNTAELRQELCTLGHSFLGHSDTEVVLHAYAQWKENCVHRINGIFALAIWEVKKKRLFLARDRIGVKPLFYSESEKDFLFASELKTILAYPGIIPRLDAQNAAELLLFGPGRRPGSGVFFGISELKPGYYGFYSNNRWKTKQYWKLMDREHTDTFEQTVEMVRYLVTDAIKRQMVSDVPIGTFLSGGLDSSIITAICSQEKGKVGERLKTFSVDYLHNDHFFKANKFQPNADTEYIRLMERYFDTNHYWTVLSPEELSNNLQEATLARDMPGMADVDFSLLVFCQEIRKHVTVALSGECADEIFGGYPWYRDPEIRAIEGFPWAQNTQDRIRMLNPILQSCQNCSDLIMDAYLQTCRDSDILPTADSQERRMKEMMNLNFSWFMQTLLDRKDRMSMYSSLEVRVPFCDYRIAEYLYGVPWEYKDYQNREKGLLRKAMEGILPEQILYRKKSPYPKTFDPEYERIMEKRLLAVLNEKESPLFHIIDKKQVMEFLRKDSPWPWYGQLMRRPQTIAYLLQLDFWLKYYHVQLTF